jgi:glycosyltransferase involved in cell wall biosynthesis
MREIVHWHENFFPIQGGGPAHIENLIHNLDGGLRHSVVTDALSGLPARDHFAGLAPVLRFPRLPLVPRALALRKRALFVPLLAFRELQTLSSKFSYLNKARFDLLHVHGVMPYNGLLTISRRLNRNVFRRFLNFSALKKPMILTLHNYLPGFTGDRYLLGLYDHFIRQFDMILCVDETIFDYCSLFEGDKGRMKDIRFIPNSIDTKRFSVAPHHDGPGLRVGLAGRASDTVDVEMINRLIAHLPGGTELRLAVAGDQGHIDASGPAAPRVRVFKGLSQEEMPGFYHGVDVVFNPVLHAGTTRVSMEAMSCGRPVIMYGISKPRYFLDDRNSFIIKRDFQELLDLLGRMTGEPEMIENKGLEARRTAEARFSNAALLPEVLKAYNDTLEKSPLGVGP